MKACVATIGFAFLIVLSLGCGSLRAQESDGGGQESSEASAPEPAADNGAAGAPEAAGETAQERAPGNNAGDPLARFNEKTNEEQEEMINRAHQGKLTADEQRQLEAAEKDHFSNMSPQQAAQEMREALSNMTPEQQDSMRSQWEQQVHGDPRFTRLSPEAQRRVLDRVKNFGKEGQSDIVTKDPEN